MKKFTKILLITALVLVVAGAVLAGAGIASGASFSAFAKNVENSGFMRSVGWLNHWDERWEHFEDDLEQELEDLEDDWENKVERDTDHWEEEDGASETEIFSADQVDQLAVDVSVGRVEIRTGTGNEIKISGLHSSDTLYFEKDDRELYIARDYEDKDTDTLVIEVPEEKRFRELDLDVSAGEIRTEGNLQADETSLGISAGNLSVALLDSRETDVECSAGNLSVKQTGSLNDYGVQLELSSGNMKLGDETYNGWKEGFFGTRNSQKTVDVEVSAGNVEISFEK